jgi:hydrogenase large subunit
MLVAYASGRPNRVNQLVDKALQSLGVGPAALFSTLGRVAARAVEAQVLVEAMRGWVDELAENMARRDYRIQDNAKWDPSSWPKDCYGAGFHEAPRGALGHWVHISNGSIVNYQCVVPSTWNAGPRDSGGHPGPYEASLVGTPVANPEQPLEILRTVHSFDPCMACGVHVVDAAKRELARVRVA